MNPVRKALWYIESHFAGEMSLDAIADAAGVSRFHLSRAFPAATGRPVTGYLRGRRLTEAARALAGGAPDILAIALEAGYGSHEAFTRAFRDQFGTTPELVRARGLDNLDLVRPILMDDILIDEKRLPPLAPPRFVQHEPMLIAGPGERYSCEGSAGIPAQWQRFVPHLGSIGGQIGNVAYGVICNADDDGHFEYVCGVEVGDFARVPREWSRVRIAPQKYAVFTHGEHISTLRNTMAAIWGQWLPQSGHEPADAPTLERYDERFDGATGLGGVEIWIPIR